MKRNQVLLILIPSFIVTVAWVVFSIYHSSVTSTISEVENIQIVPINPTFDLNAIESLKARQSIEPVYTINGQSVSIPSSPSATNPITISPIITPTPSTNSATIASGGGNLR